MRLLWGPVPARLPRGPKSALSVDEVVAAASAWPTRAASTPSRCGRWASGSDAPPWRSTPTCRARPSSSTSCGTGARGAPTTYDFSAGWRAPRAWALDLWDFRLRHPWVHQISSARPVPRPGKPPHHGAPPRSCSAVHGPQRSRRDEDRRHRGRYVAGMTRQIAELREATRSVGQSGTDWWTTQSELIAELVPDVDARFPRLAAANAEGASSSSTNRSSTWSRRPATGSSSAWSGSSTGSRSTWATRVRCSHATDGYGGPSSTRGGPRDPRTSTTRARHRRVERDRPRAGHSAGRPRLRPRGLRGGRRSRGGRRRVAWRRSGGDRRVGRPGHGKPASVSSSTR